MKDVAEPETKVLLWSRLHWMQKYIPVVLPILVLAVVKTLLLLLVNNGWEQEILPFVIPSQIAAVIVGMLWGGMAVHRADSVNSQKIKFKSSVERKKQTKLSTEKLMSEIEERDTRLDNTRALLEFSKKSLNEQTIENALDLAIKISQADGGEIRYLASNGSYKTVRNVQDNELLLTFEQFEFQGDSFSSKTVQTEIVSKDDFTDENGSRRKFWWVPIFFRERFRGYLLLNAQDLQDNEQQDLNELAELFADKFFSDKVDQETTVEELSPADSIQVVNYAEILPPLLPTLLENYIKQAIPEDEGIVYVEQIAETLASFHSEGKPFGLQPEDARVDLSARKVYLGQHVDVLVHKKKFFDGFSAPELVNSEPTLRSDVFSLGALLFSLYMHQLPAARESLGLLVENFPPVSTKLLGVDYLIKKCLLPSPENRLASASEFLNLIKKIKNHHYNYSKHGADIGADFNVGIMKGRNRGLNSSDNEDRIYWDRQDDHDWAILAVADGVSKADIGTGHDAAQIFQEQVHHLWQQSFEDPFEPQDLIKQVFSAANRAVVQHVQNVVRQRKIPHSSVKNTMSVAACLALIKEDQCYLGNLGDVRAYLVRNGFAARLTFDDSTIANLIQDQNFTLDRIKNINESELNDHIGRWQPTPDNHLEPMPIVPNIKTITLHVNDTIVLASDGLYRYARDPDGLFEDVLIKVLASSNNSQMAAFRMMSVANQRGGNDNISCVIYRTYQI